MAQRLDARAGDFPRAFNALLATKREVSEDVDQAVRAIIEDVVARGDEALIEYTRRFDGLELTSDRLRVDDTLRGQIGEAARSRALAFDLANAIRRTEAIYAAALGRPDVDTARSRA